MNKFIKALTKSLIWTLLTCVLGLLQIWMTIGITYFVKDIEFNLETTIINGSFLFFIMAIIAAITVDYFFVPPLPISKQSEIFVFYLYPFFIAFFVGSSYSLLYRFEPERLNYQNIEYAQYVVALMTLIYAIFSKCIMFYHEQKGD